MVEEAKEHYYCDCVVVGVVGVVADLIHLGGTVVVLQRKTLFCKRNNDQCQCLCHWLAL